MAGLSDALENEALDHMTNVGAYTCPTTLYLALFTTNGNFETGAYAGFTEVSTSGTNYARKTITMSTTSWNNAADASPNGKEVTNKAIAAFQWSAATANWGTVVGAALVSTSSGTWEGTGIGLSFGGALTASKQVDSGDTFEFPAASISLSLDKATEAGIADFWKAELLDHITKTDASYTAPTTAYVALFTAEPNYITGAGGTECTGGSYARKSVTQATGWEIAASGATANNGAITFTTATASWGTVLGAMLVSTTSGAFDAFAGKTLTASKPVGDGDTFSIADNDFDITLD